MNFLFVHQNFPGQFRHVAAALAENPAHRVACVGDAVNVHQRYSVHPRIRFWDYAPHGWAGRATHRYVRDLEAQVRRGQSVARVAQAMAAEGFRPDVVVSHPAWGESLFLPDLFPRARHVSYFEYYYQSSGGDLGFDPAQAVTLDDCARLRVKNSTQLLSLVGCDAGISPTQWQKSRYPAELQSKIHVMHEGVNTRYLRPDPEAVLEIGNEVWRAGDEVVTYVARNLEPYRGFHIMMRALPVLLEMRPQARVIIVGGDEVSYGRSPPQGQTYREMYCRELGDRVDWRRVSFVGKLPYAQYLKVLQVSAAHVYLTYPFVLSWSMLEAMSAGCALVASNTAPVQEVVRDGENGLLVDFFDPTHLAMRVATVLAHPEDFRAMRQAARQTVVDRYDLHSHCLPRMAAFLEGREPA